MNVESLVVPLCILNGIVFFVGMTIAGQLRRRNAILELWLLAEHPELGEPDEPDEPDKIADDSLPKS